MKKLLPLLLALCLTLSACAAPAAVQVTEEAAPLAAAAAETKAVPAATGTESAVEAPAVDLLPGDSVTAVTVTYAGKTVTCTDPAQVRAMTDAARSLEFVPTDASVTTPGAMSMELTFTDSSGSAVTLTLPLTQSGGKVYDTGADSIGIFVEILGE